MESAKATMSYYPDKWVVHEGIATIYMQGVRVQFWSSVWIGMNISSENTPRGLRITIDALPGEPPIK